MNSLHLYHIDLHNNHELNLIVSNYLIFAFFRIFYFYKKLRYILLNLIKI